MSRAVRRTFLQRRGRAFAVAGATLFAACSWGRRDEPPPPPPPEEPAEAPRPAIPPEREEPPPRPRPEPAPARRDTARPPPPSGTEALPGAILPRERIVAFYGNPRSPRMGILGELPPEQMLARLDREVAAWERADPDTPVRPALHMIAVMATGDPGPDSLYRLRMPRRAIEDVMSWAERRDALVFLDIQAGKSTVAAELRHLLPWLRHPEVHLALDPEWRMTDGGIPGKRIGTMRAAEVNHAIRELARLVAEEGLPPKVLVVHRFTRHMLPDAHEVEDDPRVQVVLNMDGWGPPQNKINTYRVHVSPAPIPFKGFKLFYRNDRWNGSRMMEPEEVLALTPEPIYIQYQ